MEGESELGLSVRSCTVRSTRNQNPKYTDSKLKGVKAKANSRIMFGRTRRTKARSSVKLTEEQRTSILGILNKELRFSKDPAEVSSSESIITLAEKMDVPSFVVCDWLGISDELDEITQIAAHLTKGQIDSTLEKMTYLGSGEGAAEIDGSEKAGDKMDEAPCLEEEGRPLEISIDLKLVQACSSRGTGSKSPSDAEVELAEAQKDSFLEMLKKFLDSSKEVLKVGSAKHIQDRENKVELPTTKELCEWLASTDDLNQVSANPDSNVRGFECQTEVKEEMEEEVEEVEEDMEEEVAVAQKDNEKDACSEKVLEVEDGLTTNGENYQESEELTPNLTPPIPESEEQFSVESLNSPDEDEEKSISGEGMEVGEIFFDEEAAKAIRDAWTVEMQEYLEVIPAYGDGNAPDREMLLTVAGNNSSELEVMDMESLSQQGVMEAPAPGSTALQSIPEPDEVIQGQALIDDYFQALEQ